MPTVASVVDITLKANPEPVLCDFQKNGKQFGQKDTKSEVGGSKLGERILIVVKNSPKLAYHQ